MFEIRERVLCIKGGFGDFKDASSHRIALCPYIPKRGAIYTVSWIGGNPGYDVMLRFYELPNPENFAGTIPVFYASCFVPLKKVATDISIFTSMLNDSRVSARVFALPSCHGEAHGE